MSNTYAQEKAEAAEKGVKSTLLCFLCDLLFKIPS